MQYDKKPHQDELTVVETITPLRLNMPVASNLLIPSCMCTQGHDAFEQLRYHPPDKDADYFGEDPKCDWGGEREVQDV
jgi:hypothetical protein